MLKLIWSIRNVVGTEWGKMIWCKSIWTIIPKQIIMTQITSVSLLLCVCFFGFVSGNWLILYLGLGKVMELWQFRLKTNVQTYLHMLFTWNSSWLILLKDTGPRLWGNLVAFFFFVCNEPTLVVFWDLASTLPV